MFFIVSWQFVKSRNLFVDLGKVLQTVICHRSTYFWKFILFVQIGHLQYLLWCFPPFCWSPIRLDPDHQENNLLISAFLHFWTIPLLDNTPSHHFSTLDNSPFCLFHPSQFPSHLFPPWTIPPPIIFPPKTFPLLSFFNPRQFSLHHFSTLDNSPSIIFPP